jgi:lactoylglutathione lyase
LIALIKEIAMNRLIMSILGRRLGGIAVLGMMGLGAAAQGGGAGPHFSHQTIFVTDLDRAANFYEKVMELKRIAEPFHDGRHVWFALGGHGQLHVVSGAKEDVPHDINIHLAFSVPSMAEFTRHLDAANVKYGDWSQKNKTPQVRPDKVLQIYLQDPDGYWIEVNDDKF